MHDGQTRQVKPLEPERTEAFLEKNRVSVTVLRGPAAGTEFELGGKRMIVGRSPETQIQIDDASVSSEHAAFELDSQGFGIRDLASTNHVLVNGAEVLSSALKHGDRIQLGECELQFVVESRTPHAKTWNMEEGA
jgi:pSer/pThr/pTyr-binding forkhead associated (FHA) protein